MLLLIYYYLLIILNSEHTDVLWGLVLILIPKKESLAYLKNK